MWDFFTYLLGVLVGLGLLFYGIEGLITKKLYIMEEKKIGASARKFSLALIFGGIFIVLLVVLFLFQDFF